MLIATNSQHHVWAFVQVLVFFWRRNRQSLSVFRDEFIKITSGLIFKGKNIPVTINGMCSDAAAATFLLKIPAYNAYYGRRKCVTPGVWVANISTVTMTKNVVLPFFSSFTYEKKTEKGVKYGVR